MSDLLWPGDHRAAWVLGDAAVLDAMLAVESAWSDALVAHDVAPPEAVVPTDGLRSLVTEDDLADLAAEAEGSGTPVAPLVSLLHTRLGADSVAARWLHRGLTSQDVVDTALMLCARDAVDVIRGDLVTQVRVLAALASQHRGTAMVARTLTQHAVPTTFGLKASQWLMGILDAYDDVSVLAPTAQLGGAGGTMAAAVELAGHLPDPVAAVGRLARDVAAALGLEPSTPWHTVRSSVTRLGDTAVRCTDAWGHVANDALALSRTEVGELSEGSAGGSSTMPHKANPVLSALVRRAALAAPALAATLHVAAADAVDERSAGAWHAEWATVRTLLRRTVVAGAQTTEMLQELRVHDDRMAATLEAARQDVRSEQATMAALTGRKPAQQYLGASNTFLDAQLARATNLLEDERE